MEQASHNDQSRIPFSFWIFMIGLTVIVLTIVLFQISPLLSIKHKYFAFMVMPMIYAMFLQSAGIYAGYVYRSEDANRKRINKIGMIGCIILMTFAMLGMLAVNVIMLVR